MKKNFLMVASLLIAAMLLVVSCAQEVKAPENKLVEARLDVAYGRDLTVSGDTKQDGITLKYTMTPQWNNNNAIGDEEIFGIVSSEQELKENGSLGFVTPGLWKITVNAYGHDNVAGAQASSKLIFSGIANVYFNETSKSAKVFLAPVESETKRNTIEFDFKIQGLSKNMLDEYTIEYKLAKDGSGYGSAVTINGVEGENDVFNYSTSATDIDSGFYRVNVSIYRKGATTAQNTLVGGTTKGFLVSGGAKVKVTGNIEPSDYENVSIDAVYVDVNTSLKNIGENGLFTGAVDYSTAGAAKATLEVDDSTKKFVDKNGYTYSVTEIWESVSDKDVIKVQNVNPDENHRKNEFTFNSPGYKNVSCTTIYSIKGTTTNDSGAEKEDAYYFTNTVTAQVYVDPDSFTVVANQNN